MGNQDFFLRHSFLAEVENGLFAGREIALRIFMGYRYYIREYHSLVETTTVGTSTIR